MTTDAPAVHICIVSGQPMPNFLPMIQPGFEPAAVALLVSDPKKLRQPLAGLKAGIAQLSQSIRRDIPIHQYDGLPDTGFADACRWGRDKLAAIRARTPGAPVLFNATGGQKPMSAAIHEVLRDDPDARVIYCDTDHGRIDFWQPGSEPRKFKLGLMAGHVLALHGFSIVVCKSDDPRWADQGKIIGLEYSKGGAQLVKGRIRITNPGERGDALEQFIYQCALRVGFNDLRGGLTMRSDPKYGRTEGNVENELDALIVHGNRALAIECKVRKRSGAKGVNQNDIHKLASVARELGLFTTAVLCTTANASENLRDRADQAGVFLAAGSVLKRLPDFLVDWKAGKVPRAL